MRSTGDTGGGGPGPGDSCSPPPPVPPPDNLITDGVDVLEALQPRQVETEVETVMSRTAIFSRQLYETSSIRLFEDCVP